MRVVNGVVILSVLTISAWKCGQANAVPGFWDIDGKKPVFDTDKIFSDDKHNQIFETKSVFPEDKVVIASKQSAEDLDPDHAGHSTGQQKDHVLDKNPQRPSSDDFVQNVNQLVVFNASKNLPPSYVNGQTKRREDSSVTPGGHPDDVRQQTDQLSRPYGQSSYDRQNGQGVYNPYNRQPGSYVPTGRQPVNDLQGVNRPSGSYGQSSYDRQNGQGVYNPYNRQPGSYVPTGRQPVNDLQGVNRPSGSYGQSSYDRQNGQGVYNPYNRQQGSSAQSERPFASDRNTEQVNPNNDQSKNNGVNYNKDWDVYSSVPLTEVNPPDGHKQLVGTSELPGGVSSVSIKKSPNSLDTSSIIKYGDLAPKGAVIISTNQQIGS